MKKNFLIFSFLLVFFSSSFGQVSLGAERVNKVKNSVVRIFVNNEPAGTGFFINNDAYVATCWHVVEGAYLPSSNYLENVQIECSDGKKYDYTLSKYNITSKDIEYARLCDILILRPVESKPSKFSSLKVGSFSDCNVGDAVYSCGYPLGIERQLFTSGIISDFYKGRKVYFRPDSSQAADNIDYAYLDLTTNKGNSGGPIIKLGASPSEDIVIGIASHIIVPNGRAMKQIELVANSINKSGAGVSYIVSNGSQTHRLDQIEIIQDIASAISSNSVGISGCIGAQHLKKLLSL